MRGIAISAAAAAILGATACADMSGRQTASGGSDSSTPPTVFAVEITNRLADEPIAPVLVAPTSHDHRIFTGDYVTAATEHQILTGDPARLAAAIGAEATVAHGMDGPPGILLAPGRSLIFEIPEYMEQARLIATVSPIHVPDNFVTAEFWVRDGYRTRVDRYDIGHNENRYTVQRVDRGVASLRVIQGVRNTYRILPIVDPLPSPGALTEIIGAQPLIPTTPTPP